MSASLWDLFEAVAARRGSAPAILQGDRRVSFAELHRMAAARATAMIREGVRPGDRCLFWAANSGKTREFMLKLGLGIFAMAFLAIALNYEAVGEWIRGILGA